MDASLSESRQWSVLRLDDNGNHFLIARFATREEAESEARLYESRGHKQTYYVQRTS
jgi:hypothetical protein